jgi:hypothetical protein
VWPSRSSRAAAGKKGENRHCPLEHLLVNLPMPKWKNGETATNQQLTTGNYGRITAEPRKDWGDA